MNTINFKMQTVIVPCGTRKLSTVTWTRELAQDLSPDYVIPHKILTVKEWIKRKKMDDFITEQFIYSSIKNIEETRQDLKIAIDEFIKKEYGYVGKT